MTASKNDQSVSGSVERRSDHESGEMNPIITGKQYYCYPYNDCAPNYDNRSGVGGRKEKRNLSEYPANDWGQKIDGT